MGKQLKFPENIMETMLGQVIVLTSDTLKQLVLLELEVPEEEWMEEASNRNRGIYIKVGGGLLQKRIAGTVLAS